MLKYHHELHKHQTSNNSTTETNKTTRTTGTKRERGGNKERKSKRHLWSGALLGRVEDTKGLGICSGMALVGKIHPSSNHCLHFCFYIVRGAAFIVLAKSGGKHFGSMVYLVCDRKQSCFIFKGCIGGLTGACMSLKPISNLYNSHLSL